MASRDSKLQFQGADIEEPSVNIEISEISLTEEDHESSQFVPIPSTNEPDAEESKSPKPSPVGLMKIYSVATKSQKRSLIIATIAAVIAGLTLPAFVVVLGRSIQSFGESEEDLVRAVQIMAIAFIIIGLVSWVTNYVWLSRFIVTSDRIANRLSSLYLDAIVKQEVSWFDKTSAASISSEITASMDAIKAGTGEKVGTVISQVCLFVGGTTVGLIRGPQLALILIAFNPLVAIGIGFLGRGIGRFFRATRKNYIEAGTVAEETLTAVRTVTAFNGQGKSLGRYEKLSEDARKENFKAFDTLGKGIAYTFSVLFFAYAVAFLFATYLMDEDIENWSTGEEYNVGDVISVFFAFLTASSVLGSIPNSAKTIYDARIAATHVFATIESAKKLIKAKGENPIEKESHPDYAKIKGDIVFQDISFRYPTRQEVKVLNKVDLTFPENQSVALVGETGCGKSTIIQLLERFYEPESGCISIGGIDIARCDPVLLRKKLALVSQEPVLFGSSILTNIRHGRPDATEEEIIEVCKKANAWNFIKNMDNGLNSYVGQRGSQLSGGQKQRIAIARALIKNPVVLLLDEATSALDNLSEKEVQEALNNLSGNVTQIMIAHRLSTIKDCDHIYVIKEGQVGEQGTFQSLKAQGGIFAGLLKYQETEEKEKDEAASFAVSRQVSSGFVATDGEVRVLAASDKRKSSTGKSIMSHQSEAVLASPTQTTPGKKSHWLARLLRDNKQYRSTIVVGCSFSSVMGMCYVFQGYLLASIIEAMQDPDSSDFSTVAYRISISYCVLAVIVYVAIWGKFHYLTQVGEHMVKTVRMKVFGKILTMPMGFFDLPQNKIGALTSQLELSTGVIRRVSGGVIGNSTQALTGYCGALAIAYYYNWILSIPLTLLSPLLVIRVIAERSQMKGGFRQKDERAVKEAGALVSEGVTNIRTVHSLNIEKDLTQSYTALVSGSDDALVRDGRRSGLIMGLGEFSPNLMYAIAFLIGGYMVQNDHATIMEVMVPIFVFVSGVRTLADFLAVLMDISAAKDTMVKMIEFEDTPSAIDPSLPGGLVLPQKNVRGEIEIKDVHFAYPTREEPVLNGLSLKVPAGKTVALVGPSGCGKSTVISLMLRFYDPSQGQIFIDDNDIKNMNIKNLRNIMSLVAQEPILFNTSIRENIKYGCPSATDEEMIQAAEKANARKFIEGNEIDEQEGDESARGYDRNVGLGGSKLSGGQKQRIAIARAIIRKPKILLLDEATSALDSQSEAIVQEALNSMMKGKSTIVIAHRISTIESADKIAVIREGVVVEEGSYSELMEKQEQFYALAKALK